MDEIKKVLNEVANESLGKFQEAERLVRRAIEDGGFIVVTINVENHGEVKIPITSVEAIAELTDFLHWNIEHALEEFLDTSEEE